MKRIILVLISVVMLFAACEKNVSDDTASSQSVFDNLTLGMSVVELIDTVGRQPDKIVKGSDHDRYDEYYDYRDEEFLGVNAYDIEC